MRKRILITAMVCITLSGCSSGVTQGQYESVSSAASIAESQKESLSSELESLNAEYSAYKESMEQYEGLGEAGRWNVCLCGWEESIERIGHEAF